MDRDERRDSVRLSWLERRGRVKARFFGNMEDDWKWDLRSEVDLRTAIDLAMQAERDIGPSTPEGERVAQAAFAERERST